jgi:outer membrane protein OmpA-like peptidoglycan-associated protein
MPIASGLPAQQPKSGGIFKLVLVGLALVAFLFIAVVSGVAYLGYRAKKKVEKIEQAYKDKDVHKLASELRVNEIAEKIAPGSSIGTASSDPGASDDSYSTLAEAARWKTYTGSPASGSSVLVPLKTGLEVVHATYDKSRPDYETIVDIRDVLPAGIGIDFTYLGPPQQNSQTSKPTSPSTIRSAVTQRTVLSQDLLNAHEVQLYYSHQDPRIFPGTTTLEVSKEVFNLLKTSSGAPFHYHIFKPPTMESAISNLLSKVQSNSGEVGVQDILPGSTNTLVECTMKRATPDDIAFPVILNDKPVELPAIHSICKSGQDEMHMYILDELENPLILAGSTRLGHFKGQTIRINFPEEKAVNPIEQDLKQSHRAQVYGIYFDFGKSTIRPQSKPVLQEIAKAMKDNPSWKLTVEGHTDNIGGDESNQDLSKRRASAVAEALETQYHIAANRFTSAGFGASRPVETNDTLEGRARNRRVELVRE